MYTTQTSRLLIGLLAAAILAHAAAAEPADDQYALAAGYYSQSRWQDAVRQFRSFLKQHPDSRRADLAAFFLGEALVQLGEYDEAHEVLGQFLQRYPAHHYLRQALFRYGETAYLSGKDEPAREQLARFHQTYPDDPLCAYVLPYLGEIALRGGQAQQAVQYYEEAMSKFPQGPLADQCRLGIGRALKSLGKAVDALRWYRYLSSSQTSPLADDALLEEGLLHYQRERYADAAKALQQLETRFPQSALLTEARYWRGMAQLGQNDWRAASRTLVRAAQDDPEHRLAPAIEFSAGEAFRQGGDAAEARLHYRRVLEQWPNSQWVDDSLQRLVQLAVEGGDYESVPSLAAEFEEHHRSSPLGPLVRQLLGQSLLKREKYEEAIQTLRQAAEPPAGGQAANASALNYLLALAYIGAGRYQEGLGALDRVDAPEAQKELAARVQRARATALVGLKDYAGAVDAQRKYLALWPDGPDAAQCRSELATTLAQLGKFDEALEAQGQLAGEHPDCSLLLPTTHFVAEAAYREQRFDIARPLFAQLAQPDNPPPWVEKGLFGLAWVQAETGDADQAAETFGRLLEQSPESVLAPEAAMMRARLLENQGRRDEALRGYQLVVDRYARSKEAPQAVLAVARLQSEQGDRSAKEAAAALLKRAVAEHAGLPNLDAALYQLAWCLTDLGRSEEARAVFARLSKEFPDSRYWPDATYRLAAEAAQAEQIDRAKQLTDRLIESAPAGDVRDHALYLRGQLAAAESDWPRVTDLMQRLLAKPPSEALRLPGQYWLAESLYRRGQWEKAEEQFQRLARQTGDRQEAWMAMIPLRRAQILAQKKRWEEALELAQKIADRFPHFRQQYEVDYLIGRCLASRGRFAEARQAYERVVRSPAGGRTETAAMAQWMIGESYFHQKNYAEAIKAYHRVETLYAYPQWQAGALLQAGKCYERQGDWENAVKLYAQLLRHYPATPFTEQASQRLLAAQQKLAVAALPHKNAKPRTVYRSPGRAARLLSHEHKVE